jgi:GMP synthase (glutamine-hydrolysing)
VPPRRDRRSPQRFLIVETGQPIPSLRRLGRFPHWIRVAAGLAADEADAVNVEGGEPLPAPATFTDRDYTGVIVTGSSSMVTDRHVWSERTADWLRGHLDAGLPVLGICYGHQLLAHTLGGEVDYNPQGREMGTVAVDLHPHAGEDPLFRPLPERFEVQVSHLQSVLRPPAGATVLARSDQDACQAFRWRDHAWGLQFHPEFSTEHMRGYVHSRREALHREGRCHQRMAREVKPTPLARGVLRRFVRHAATLRGH